MRYLTGLPTFKLLMTIFNSVSDCVHISQASALPPFKQFLVVLMKLRLHVGDELLAYLFRVSQSPITRYVATWIDILFIKLRHLIQWLCRDVLLKAMPMNFRAKFSQCVIIIDCFKSFIEHPTSLRARAQTRSNYTQHNTAKYLIGVAPQGAVAFISKGWGGRTSYVHITERCGLLNELLPGDTVLADRGFCIADSVCLYHAEVKLPAFTRGKKQLSQVEVDKACELSRVHIHVERVIGLVGQKCSILQSTIPINVDVRVAFLGTSNIIYRGNLLMLTSPIGGFRFEKQTLSG